MDLGLKDQWAVIVGAASGIGQAISEAFLQEQANVVVADISSHFDVVVEQLKVKFPQQQARGIHVDVTDRDSVAKLAEFAEQYCGAPIHLVCAAGTGSGQYGFPFWDVDPDCWSRVLEVNLTGAMRVVHAFAPLLVQHEQGTVLLLSSVAGQMGSQTDPPYSAAKAGVLNFAQCAAKDFARYGVRVNSLCPGMVKTPLNRSVWQAWANKQRPEDRIEYEQWAEEKISKVVPLGRWQTPEDLGNMAVFLASDRARNVTGQALNVDGGFVMH